MRPINAEVLPIPGMILGPYPERRPHGKASKAGGGAHFFPSTRGYERFLEAVAALDAATGGLDRARIAERLRETRAAMARNHLTDELIAEAFMLVKRTC